MAERWQMDRLALKYGAEYDLVATPSGVAAVPHETGRDTLRAHTPGVLAVLLGQAHYDRCREDAGICRG